jgi:hypothetical protein
VAQQQYDNELRGVLFKNTQQREGKQDPQARGSCTINGVEYWVDAWTEEVKRGDRAGQRYQSLKFRPKDAPDVRGGGPGGDDIPW